MAFIIQYKMIRSDSFFKFKGIQNRLETVKLGVINYPYFRHELINCFYRKS